MIVRPHVAGTHMMESHVLDIPQCCPVSHNPLSGSTITICYRPMDTVLDVIPLPIYIRSFIGGLRNAAGEIEVRDMEHMIQRIANDCCQAVGVPVRVYARLLLRPTQTMLLKDRAYPK